MDDNQLLDRLLKNFYLDQAENGSPSLNWSWIPDYTLGDEDPELNSILVERYSRLESSH